MPRQRPCSSPGTRSGGDRVDRMFPGPGLEIPNNDERDRADAIVGYTIPRQRHGAMPYFANPQTNRALLRSHVRRHLTRSNIETTSSGGHNR